MLRHTAWKRALPLRPLIQRSKKRKERLGYKQAFSEEESIFRNLNEELLIDTKQDKENDSLSCCYFSFYYAIIVVEVHMKSTLICAFKIMWTFDFSLGTNDPAFAALRAYRFFMVHHGTMPFISIWIVVHFSTSIIRLFCIILHLVH